MKNEKIVSAFDCVVLSEEDAQRIYINVVSSALHTPKRTVSRRAIAVLAALVIVIAAGSFFEGKLISNSAKKEYTVVDMGENALTGIPEREAGNSDVRYNEEWLLSHSSYTMLAIGSDQSSAVFYGLGRNIYGDYEELKSLIPENCLLQLPEYIPEGFEFSEACVRLYLTEEEVENAAQAELPFISDGIVYQCYQFPESVTDNIAIIIASYMNDNGETITVMSDLVEDYTLITEQGDNALEIKGFERAVYTRDSHLIACCEAEMSIEPVTVFPEGIMGYEERSAMLGTEALYPGSMEYSTKNCTVSSKTVSADELIKMLESLA